MAAAACAAPPTSLHAEPTWTCRKRRPLVTDEGLPQRMSNLMLSDKDATRVEKRTIRFLELPAELRLELYTFFATPEARGCANNDELDIARFTSFDTIDAHDRLTRKSYSWLLSHRTVFDEAIDIVCATHPLVIYKVEDIRKSHNLLQVATEIILDVESASPNDIRQALQRLRNLPQLERLSFRASPQSMRHVRLPIEIRGFEKLSRVDVVDLKLQREEQRHSNQYSLEAKMIEDSIKRLNIEITKRESRTELPLSKENFHSAIGDLDQLHAWSAVELYMTKQELELKLQWQHLRNSPEPSAGLEERRIMLRCQQALLKRDLATRKATAEDEAARQLAERCCQHCGHAHQ